MFSPEVQIIREKFAQFYKEKDFSVCFPTRLKRREFGFLLFRERAMLRHKKFEDVDRLVEFIGTLIPSHVYYSCAYFEAPEQEMERKGWLGADLVFDIDSDHIPSTCGKIHDSWLCRTCGFPGKGPSPAKCPRCGETRFDSKTWACEVCIESTKGEAIKLVNMLLEDFGISRKSVKAYYSGHRGYHVHVEDGDVHELDSVSRKEIVDYIIGLGLKSELHRFIDNKKIYITSTLEGGGWKKRIPFGIHEFMMKSTSDEVDKLGLSKSVSDYLAESRETLQDLGKRGWINMKGNPKSWKKIINLVVSKQSSRIDTVVTTDIHRLIRLNGSLHGKTAFMKTEVPLNGFDKFDPLKEAIAFKKGVIIVDIAEAPKFRIGDKIYGPYKNDLHVELPSAAALFLLCKGAAKVVSSNV